MEFYFQEELRWAYGFDNPNKAAALIATLLPVVWILVCWFSRIRKPALRWVASGFGLALLIVGWGLLFKTYSRGGIVAAAAGFAYVGFCNRGAVRRHWLLTGAVVAAVFALFISTQAAMRSLHGIASPDASVENRISVWKGGLRMIADKPLGVGHGNSGLLYMRWYQPLDATARYRTLVNSYLTFLVEQGVWKFGLAVFGAGFVWFWTRDNAWSSRSGGVLIGLRGALVAFAVAGIFSTTMEEPSLWVVPALCGAGLVAMGFFTAWKAKTLWANAWKAAGAGLCAASMTCGLLWSSGFLLNKQEPLRVALSGTGDEGGTVDLTLRGGSKPERLAVLVDEQVMGEDYGKLLRRLVIETGMPLEVCGTNSSISVGATEVLVAGEQIGRIAGIKDRKLILLAPAITGESEAQEILSGARSVVLLLPGFDEDGRVSFWRDMAGNQTQQSKVKSSILAGVGNEISSEWQSVIREIRAGPELAIIKE